MIALKCARRDVVDWLLKFYAPQATVPSPMILDVHRVNKKGVGVREVARAYKREHLLSAHPDILTARDTQANLAVNAAPNQA